MLVIVKAVSFDREYRCRQVVEWPDNVRLPNTDEILFLGSSDGLKVSGCSFFIDGPSGPGYEPETDAPNYTAGKGTLYTTYIHVEADTQSLAKLVEDCGFTRL